MQTKSFDIKNGTLGTNANSPDKANVFYRNKVVVIAYELRGETVAAILTAFKAKSKV